MISLMDKQGIIIDGFLKGNSQWEIHRNTGFDRKTIRKYIREYEESRSKLLSGEGDKLMLTEEIVESPKYDSSNRTKIKLTEVIMDKIDFYLEENREKRSTGKGKQQKKNIDIHSCLIDEGHNISYSTVCNYIRNKLNEKKEAYIRQEYELGHVVEFDWGHVKLEIDGEDKNIQMAVMVTAKGNYRFAYLYQNQKMESFLDSHVRFFNHIGGVHKEIVYDNMKVAVKRFVTKTEKEPTEELLKLSMYYGFNYRFCNARRGNEKGHVERSVEYVRRKAFSKKDKFETLEEANKYLEEELIKLNSKEQKYNENKTAKDILIEEVPYLIKLMPTYDISRLIELRVNKYSVITIDENKYSVPDYLVGKFVMTKVYPNKIIIYHENNKVAEHKRSFGLSTWDIEIKHYLNTLKKKPGAIHNSTAMRQMNSKLQNIYNKYYTQNPRDFIDLIELISKEDLEKIEKIIKELEKISPLNIDTEKIKLLCYRKNEAMEENKYKNTEIEKQSKLILSDYGKLLNNSSIEFDKGALII
ncbi:IS21 family transposase [Tissierella pigra]|uniref:IS21 family transposase n=1 Tax=Tissierella pigra TaxID=2607614 RepID=A0A6N7XM74_9FIRM|nr:IS21 family transposase [Tissierella pigra]MBU5426151.1 IS21 family transposase [Tissierella pigra]MBU5426194.1 IS21 family transposase [Tissierella pigra]MBU5427080.1 IS21 family transposase [Tissierella pigra]MSU01882.1 IS21 family transposase [Tissierella pigra]